MAIDPAAAVSRRPAIATLLPQAASFDLRWAALRTVVAVVTYALLVR